jgi:hypothetical protein
MEAAELALSDLVNWHRLVRNVPFAHHNLALSGGGLQIPTYPPVRPS